MDLFDLKIIGWEYSTTTTDDLAVKDLEKAYKARNHNIRIHGSLNFMTPNQKYLLYLNSLQ